MNIYTHKQFLQFPELKHKADVTTGDEVLVAINSGGIPVEELQFVKVECTGYAGKDEFWGEDEQGKERGWCDSDVFKVVGPIGEVKFCDITSSDDYASMDCGNYNFYYGWEVQDPNTEEWCFVVKKGNTVIMSMKESDIKDHRDPSNDNPQSMLLLGISIFLQKFKLV